MITTMPIFVEIGPTGSAPHIAEIYLTCDFVYLPFPFYRAMHCSAKRGIAIACRLSLCPSVCLSVTLVDQDHIGRKSWKLIARTLSLTPSLFVAQRSSTYSQGNMGKFWGE